ncbi:MAG: septal ring lytic transglycosylase RlpA family protein [Spirochaetota bacterium]
MKKLLSLVCALCLFGLTAGPAAAAERGIASWYGGKFHGRLTANGEIFDTNKLTAAHRTLPFDTRVKVTNQNNGKSVIVRINDRGPFLHGRIIDLSQAAAMKIGMLESGTAPVTVEVLKGNDSPTAASSATAASAAEGSSSTAARDSHIALPEPTLPEPSLPSSTPSASSSAELPKPDFPGGENSPETQAPSSANSPGSPRPASQNSAGDRFSIQLGSFSDRDNALGLKSRLERAGFLPRLEEAGVFTRVVLTGLTETEVSRTLSSLERSGFRDYIVRAD